MYDKILVIIFFYNKLFRKFASNSGASTRNFIHCQMWFINYMENSRSGKENSEILNVFIVECYYMTDRKLSFRQILGLLRKLKHSNRKILSLGHYGTRNLQEFCI